MMNLKTLFIKLWSKTTSADTTDQGSSKDKLKTEKTKNEI